jgi:hypothetical protein
MNSKMNWNQNYIEIKNVNISSPALNSIVSVIGERRKKECVKRINFWHRFQFNRTIANQIEVEIDYFVIKPISVVEILQIFSCNLNIERFDKQFVWVVPIPCTGAKISNLLFYINRA